MSSIVVCCPGCQKKYKVPATATPRKIRCQACQALLTVPVAADEDEALPVAVVDDNITAKPARPRPNSRDDRADDKEEPRRERRRSRRRDEEAPKHADPFAESPA